MVLKVAGQVRPGKNPRIVQYEDVVVVDEAEAQDGRVQNGSDRENDRQRPEADRAGSRVRTGSKIGQSGD